MVGVWGVLSSSYQGSKHAWVLYAKKHPLAPGCRAVLYLLHIVIIYLFIHPTWTSRVLFHKHRFEGFFFTLTGIGVGVGAAGIEGVGVIVPAGGLVRVCATGIEGRSLLPIGGCKVDALGWRDTGIGGSSDGVSCGMEGLANSRLGIG
jgi:hypothetical protein